MHLDDRARGVLLHIVEMYLESRLPVGSRTLSKTVTQHWSPATLRNVMSDLEEMDLLTAPHRSAGRLPTAKALRFYIQQMIPKALPKDVQSRLHGSLDAKKPTSSDWLHALGQTLADVSQCASIVFVSQRKLVVQSLDFIPVSSGKALAVLITQCGQVEHRLISVPQNVKAEQLQEASNYLNARFSGRTLARMREELNTTIDYQKAHLHALASDLLQKSADWETSQGHAIIKGQSQLLDDVQDLETLQTIKALFSWLETQEMFQKIFDEVWCTEGLQLFVGTEHPLFNVGECSFVLAPYGSPQDSLWGGVGVIGPLYMDYRRIVPLIDGTINMIERINA